MAKPRTGTLERCRDASGKTYFRGRLRLRDGSRPRVRVPEKFAYSEERAAEWIHAIQEQEDQKGRLLAKRQATNLAKATGRPAGETCDEWYDRYHEHQRALGRSSARDARYCFKAWVSPRIGAKPMASVTRDDIEGIRDALDTAIELYKANGKATPLVAVSGKRTMNIWSALVSAFKEATTSKRRDLRVLAANPCTDVQPPGDRRSRQARRKPFIYPTEFDRLVACQQVPLEWRELHAIAAYAYLRPGELRVLRWSDIDMAHGIIQVTRSWDSRDDKVKAPKTRNGVRPIPIEPALMPLLERMRRDAAPDGLVVPLLAASAEDFIAETTRKHLRMAGLTRPALFVDTVTSVRANFRSWRDSGITWLALAGIDVVKIQRRAGHDNIATTLGYVKQAEELAGQPLGTPFAALPSSLVEPERSTERATLLPVILQAADIANETQCEGRDLKTIDIATESESPLDTVSAADDEVTADDAQPREVTIVGQPVGQHNAWLASLGLDE